MRCIESTGPCERCGHSRLMHGHPEPNPCFSFCACTGYIGLVLAEQ